MAGRLRPGAVPRGRQAGAAAKLTSISRQRAAAGRGEAAVAAPVAGGVSGGLRPPWGLPAGWAGPGRAAGSRAAGGSGAEAGGRAEQGRGEGGAARGPHRLSGSDRRRQAWPLHLQPVCRASGGFAIL